MVLPGGQAQEQEWIIYLEINYLRDRGRYKEESIRQWPDSNVPKAGCANHANLNHIFASGLRPIGACCDVLQNALTFNRGCRDGLIDLGGHLAR